jgi:putative Mg2+ transporter-C (MgtC) family protein
VFRQAVGRDQVVRGLNTAAAIFAAAAIGAAAGQGRLLVAAVAAAVCAFVLEIRHIPWLSMLDGRRWAGKVRDDEEMAGVDRRGGSEDP